MLTFGLNSASVLAQVNIGTNPASILGIFLAIAGAGLYFLRTVRPELSRDQDIFFAAVGLLCGFIFIFQGWRLDPILQFGQLLLVGTTVYFAYESIRLRGIATQQAKRSTPIVDRDRDVSERYDYDDRGRYGAEVEDFDRDPLPYNPYYEEERPPRPQIRGSRDNRSSRNDYYDDEAPRRLERRKDTERNEEDRPPRRRSSSSRRTTNRSTSRFEENDWGSSSQPASDWDNSPSEEKRTSRRSTRRTSRPRNEDDIQPRTSRKRRPSRDSESRRERGFDEVIPTDYEDYNPIVRLEDEKDNPVKLDDE